MSGKNAGKNKGSSPTLPNSPYMPLRKDRPVKIDVHPPPLSLSLKADDFPQPFKGGSKGGKGGNVWIKPKNNSVVVPAEVLEILKDDIEKRHAGSTQAEEIVFYQDARPFRETIKKSWAAGLSLMLILVSIFICIGIAVYAPAYLMGAALLPPLIAFIVTALLIKRIRVDLAGCYALTKYRAIIIVPKKHLGFLKPMVLSYDFLTEKNLIMVQMHEDRLQDKILSRDPVLTDVIHAPNSVATVSFYPRTKFSIPFRFQNVQNSHAFELDWNSTMLNSPAPTNGGQLKIEKPDFAQQQAASKKFKIYPILGAVWFLLIIGTISALLWGVFYTQATRSPLTITMVVLSWFFGVSLSIASFYPIYALSRQKREAIANGRYAKCVIYKQ